RNRRQRGGPWLRENRDDGADAQGSPREDRGDDSGRQNGRTFGGCPSGSLFSRRRVRLYHWSGFKRQWWAVYVARCPRRAFRLLPRKASVVHRAVVRVSGLGNTSAVNGRSTSERSLVTVTGGGDARARRGTGGDSLAGRGVEIPRRSP